MADAPPPPPVAIRITRPYESEEEYLANELEMISKTSITLVGAQPRPQGVVLRFELVLASGHVLVRGEGRVVGFKPNAHRGVGGLTLRFTRIDARSKSLLDKATAMRELRRPSSKPPKVPEQAAGEPPPAAAAPAPSPEAAPPALADTAPSPPPAPPVEARRPPEPASAPELPPVLAVSPPPNRLPARAAAPPQDRDALLERLRARAQALQPAAVQRILDQKRS